MHDLPVVLPRRYGGQVDVMTAMHWGWRELCDAPADLGEEIAVGVAQEVQRTGDRRKSDKAR